MGHLISSAGGNINFDSELNFIPVIGTQIDTGKNTVMLIILSKGKKSLIYYIRKRKPTFVLNFRHLS